MDLAIGAKSVFVMMNLFTKDGTAKIVPTCTYPLTGLRCVRRVYTEYAVFDIDSDAVACQGHLRHLGHRTALEDGHRAELNQARRLTPIGSWLVRAVLIVNPNATSTTPPARPARPRAREPGQLTIAHTDSRGHAIDIARDAARDGIDVLIVHGGDGTVNEVVNGVLGNAAGSRTPTRPRSAWCPAARRTCFARALGISPDPTEATNQLIDLLGEHRRTKSWRRIGLMDCGERWGVFTAGLGGRRRRGGGRRSPA
jgi:hypothetical protein